MRRGLGLGAVALVAAFGFGQVASAQDVGGSAGAGAPAIAPGLDLVGHQAFWTAGKQRAFVSSVLEGGLYYTRATVATGYGKPHWNWIGVEAQAQLGESYGSDYAGVRLTFPFFELRAGGRAVFPVSHRFLPKESSVDDDEFAVAGLPRAHYGTGELEGAVAAPFLHGAIYAVGSAFLYGGVPSQYLLFDELLRIVVEPPLAWRVRVGQTVRLPGKLEEIQIGVAGEIIDVPKRDALTVRVGPQIAVALTYHLDATATALFPVATRDSLGLQGADFSQFGLRYRWATGDPFPGFP